ncbi:ABC transporter permease [Microbulbifer rhizosphaerae]|uniref:NitT/TauT family transport system permease protein n=1 Tax=Microbulbifer rhizosphaerae TaxID=1562603 RepID=A0A7W4WBC4_9GAMM|nr:ABC transporter permease [Microbulbifer rhizosphaerae]MBB3061157.1 NitT/TauT family transport system permease protein [Microbulbifer rhizosphaerae]
MSTLLSDKAISMDIPKDYDRPVDPVKDGSEIDNSSVQGRESAIENKSDRLSDLFSKYFNPDRIKMIGIGSLSVIAGILIWHYATKYNFNYFINFENVPSPGTVGSAFLVHGTDSEFHTHVQVSIKRILIAYSLAVILGVVIGVMVGRSRSARAAVLPYIEVLRPIPAVAWIPLAILMWPTEESSIIYITFLGALFPIILNTVHGVEQTPKVLVRAALSLGAKRLDIFWHVVLPAALPSIAAGLAIGMGVSWFSLLAGEIISGQYGIGYFTWNAYSLINYPDIIVGMLVIGGLGSLSTYLVRLAMAPSLRWKKTTH